MDKKLEARIIRLENLLNKLSKNESDFSRRVNPNKQVKFNQDDFANVDSITLYIDGDDIDSISTAGYDTLEVLKRLMTELSSYVKSNIKGIKNSEWDAWLEFNDINETVVNRCDLPTIYTDSMGRIEIEHIPRRGLSNVDKVCLNCFDKYCLI